MWRIWFFFGILEISFAAPVETSHEDIIPSSELTVLRCLLSSPLNGCDDVKRSTERIPKRIQKLYDRVKKPLLNATTHEVLDSASDSLPASLLYLIPKIRLASMTGFKASEIVRRFPFDDALTMKILSLFTDKLNIEAFLSGLSDKEEFYVVSDDEFIEEESIKGIAPISPAVEKEIAHALSRWFPRGSQWEYWLYKASMITGTPVLASLPNYFLNSLTVETTEKFLFHLRNWRWDSTKSYDLSWNQHSMSVKRIWCSILLNKAEPPNRWTPKIVKQLGFFLIGGTPDELSQLSTDLRISQDFKLLLDLNWNAMQARSVFDVGFSGRSELTESDLNNVMNMILHLLPRQIQQFSHNATNFEYFKYNTGISLATGKQLFSSHVAHIISKNKTHDVSPKFWKEHMFSTGKFFHLMPPSLLEPLQNESFDLESLAKCDSPLLSVRHARYLTNSGKAINISKPETVLRFKGLLKSVPSVNLVELPKNLISNLVKEHLLMFASGESVPFAASVLEKMRSDLVETSYLEKLLYNKDFKQYFNLLGNRDITNNFKDVSLKLFDVVSRNPVIERNVRLLPVSTLSALLSIHREEVIKRDNGWNYDNLIESHLKLYISGLTCADIEILETSDFMPVIGYYVHQRRAMNEPFPKNMQYCCQKAMTKYFKLKASLRGLNNEPLGLVSLMELHEVRAIGGFILAGLPLSSIETLAVRYQVVSEIGKLSIPELLTATSIENIRQFAEMYVGGFTDLNLQIMTGLGNLVWFLKEDKIQKLNVKDFKLHVESMEENGIKALCLNEKERNAWKQLLIRAFGKPDSWSSGTLYHLGDLLLVFDSYELERINKTPRIEAADVLSRSTSFYTILEWPGKTKPVYLYEACLEILKIPEKISFRASLKQLLRFYLESNQYLLDTVASAQTILKLNEEPNLVESASSQGSPIISTHVSSPFSTSESLSIPINPTLEVQSEEYDFSSEETPEENYEDEKDSVGTESITPPVTVSAVPEKSVGTSKSSDTSSSSPPRAKLMTKHSVSKAIRWKRFGTSESQSGKMLKEESEDSKIFHSKSTKSFEELQKELQRNASRDLVVEVPLNQTDFVHFGGGSSNNLEISCDAIRMLNTPSSFILNLQDFEKMKDDELEDCAEFLGSLNLDSNVRSYIWRRLKKWKESGNLLEVGNLVTAIEENDITTIPLKLSEAWALENLNALSTHITNNEMMLFITDQFLLKNKDLQGLKYESAVAMGRLICTMTLSHQRKYLLNQPDVFINVAKSLGRSLDCSNIVFESCIRHLANIATSPDVFGETHKWTANDVSDLGIIVAGLRKSDWELKNGKGLKPEAFAGLSPSAVSCISPDVFKVLNEDQLRKIPTLSAATVSNEQSSSLSPSQYEIIDRVRRQVPPADLTMSYSSSGFKASKPSLLLSVALVLFVYTSRTFVLHVTI